MPLTTPGFDADRAHTSETLMELSEVPEHLVVIGGGYVACELGQAYRRFGAAVTMVQSRKHLLPREEPDISTVLERVFSSEGIELQLGSQPVRVEHSSGGSVRVTVRDAEGAQQVVEGSHLLVATGRRPNTDTLDLDAAGVRTDDRGYVVVNDRLEATTPGIWAVGDVNGYRPFTRVCQEQGKLARSILRSLAPDEARGPLVAGDVV